MTWHYIEKLLILALSFVQVEHWTLHLRAWPVWGTLREGEGDVMQTSSQKKDFLTPQKWTDSCFCPLWLSLGHFFTTFLNGQTTSTTMGSLFFSLFFFLLVMHFFVSWLCLMGHQGIFKEIKKTHLHYNSIWNVCTCIYLANPGAIVLSSWQDSLHHQLNGFSPNSGPQKKPLAFLQAYLSCGQHTWSFYVGQKNSDKMLSSGRGRELLSFPGPCIPALPPSFLYIPLPSASVWPVMLLPFFYNSKKHNKVTKRTRLWVLLYEILGFRAPD